MIRVSHVSVEYPRSGLALDDVNFELRKAEFCFVTGHSGAGKSTLLRLLYERRNTDAGLVTQDFGLVKSLSVFHNVYMARLRRHSALYNLANIVRPLRREVEAMLPLLRRVDLEDKLFEPAGQLSGGQQQRTAVARALHQQSPALLADEPVSSVDEHQSRRVLDAIVETHETVILAMHDTELAIAYADRIIGLEDGRIVIDRPTTGMKSAELDELYAA
jgi:phosphonate transport system ATP-binding protein